jgi:SAM-dependent methyltransferase
MSDPETQDQTMYEFYRRYYAAVQTSQAHAVFCEQAYGENLCQHGFMDREQFDYMLDALQLTTGEKVLELGCGNGMVAERISDRTGAHIMGIDYIPEAIRQANERTREKRARLVFEVGDIGKLDFPPGAFDVMLSVDTLYFNDLTQTLEQSKQMLHAGGRMGIYYTHGIWEDPSYPPESLLPDQTPLAEALLRLDLPFEWRDFTRQDHDLAERKIAALERLKPVFEAEGNQFLYDNRIAESHGQKKFTEQGTSRRYFYLVRIP